MSGKIVYEDDECIISEFTEEDEDKELVELVKQRLKDKDKMIKVNINDLQKELNIKPS